MADETKAYTEKRARRTMRSSEQVVGKPVELDIDLGLEWEVANGTPGRRDPDMLGGERVDLECTLPVKHGPHVHGKQKERWCRGRTIEVEGLLHPQPLEGSFDGAAAHAVVRAELLMIYDLMAKGSTAVVCPVCSREKEVRCLGQHPHRQRLELWLDNPAVMETIFEGMMRG